MKRLFILTALLAVLGLSSCEKEPSKSIIGTWEVVTIEATIEGVNMSVDLAEQGLNVQFTFNADGTGFAYMEAEGVGENSDFVYEIHENLLSISMEDETVELPFTIDKTSMTMEVDGAILGEEVAKAKIHLKKK